MIGKSETYHSFCKKYEEMIEEKIEKKFEYWGSGEKVGLKIEEKIGIRIGGRRDDGAWERAKARR